MSHFVLTRADFLFSHFRVLFCSLLFVFFFSFLFSFLFSFFLVFNFKALFLSISFLF